MHHRLRDAAVRLRNIVANRCRWLWSWCCLRPRITGKVYATSETVGDLRLVGFPHENVWCGECQLYTDNGGWYDTPRDRHVRTYLHGRHARVSCAQRSRDGSDQVVYEGPAPLHWNRHLRITTGHPDFDALMAYYHVTRARDAFSALVGEEVLGLRDANNRGGPWLTPMHVTVNAGPEVTGRAHWDADDGEIRIRPAYAKDALLIYHEYAHAVTDLLTGPSPFPYEDETGSQPEAVAVSEAIADYLACSLKKHCRMLGGFPHERCLTGDHRYQHTGEAHADSLALSSSLWELRGHLKAGKVDGWVIEMLHRLRLLPAMLRNLTFQDVRALLIDIEQEDPDSGGTRGPLIAAVFSKHGIS